MTPIKNQNFTSPVRPKWNKPLLVCGAIGGPFFTVAWAIEGATTLPVPRQKQVDR